MWNTGQTSLVFLHLSSQKEKCGNISVWLQLDGGTGFGVQATKKGQEFMESHDRQRP